MNAETLEIRNAATADLEAVETLLEASELPVVEVAEWLDRYVVARDADRIVGVAGLEVHGSDGILRSVAVDPSHRGRGLGDRLTAAVIERARSEGLRRLYLLTTTAEDYFGRRGFRRIAREAASEDARKSVEFREACPASAAVMELELSD